MIRKPCRCNVMPASVAIAFTVYSNRGTLSIARVPVVYDGNHPTEALSVTSHDTHGASSIQSRGSALIREPIWMTRCQLLYISTFLDITTFPSSFLLGLEPMRNREDGTTPQATS